DPCLLFLCPTYGVSSDSNKDTTGEECGPWTRVFHAKGVICMDRSSELCKEVDDSIKIWADYAKEMMESEECKRDNELVKKPGGETTFG
ncbi:hypothetical protein AVEN_263062-1, partial [Araneus ventricosus]